MIKVEILDKVDKDRWNLMVKSLPEGTFYQTTYMAEWQKIMHAYKPLFLIAKEDSEIVGQLLFFEFFYAAYSWSRHNFLRPALPAIERLFRTYTWFYGPLIFKKEKFSYILGEILKSVDSYIQHRGGLMVRNAVPPIHNLAIDQSVLEACFKSSGYKITPRGTIMVNTAEPIEELWNSLKKGSRYDVKKALKDGIEVKIDKFSIEALRKFHDVRLEAAGRGRTYRSSFAYLKRGLEFLRDTDTSKFFSSYINGIPLSFNVILYFNGVASQTFPLNSNYCLDNRLFGNHILTWKVIEWANKRDCRWFDFVGITPNIESRTPKEEGIFKFKARWGGLKLHYAHYEKIFSYKRYKLIAGLKRGVFK